jgi:hypothetical protein
MAAEATAVEWATTAAATLGGEWATMATMATLRKVRGTPATGKRTNGVARATTPATAAVVTAAARAGGGGRPNLDRGACGCVRPMVVGPRTAGIGTVALTANGSQVMGIIPGLTMVAVMARTDADNRQTVARHHAQLTHWL